jgi:hypothetical protein
MMDSFLCPILSGAKNLVLSKNRKFSMSKKDAREAALKTGLDRLRESGIDTENASATALGALTNHLGKGHDTDLAVAFLLGRVADPAAVAALTELERTAASKDIKREARRSLFKLAQRGMTIPRAEDAGIAKPRPALKLGPEIEGYISSVDGAGVRLVWLTRPQPDGGLQLLQGMVSDRTGLERASGALIKRKELREQAQAIKESHGIQMISVPWEYADQMLYESYEKAKSLGQGRTEHFSSLRAAFNPLKPKPAPHPIHSRLSPDGARAEAWRERSRRLLDEPEFRFWILDDDWMAPYLERVEQARESRLVLNEVQKEERVSAIVRDAARKIFAGETGRVFARRMEDMALYLLETGREEPAKLALAVALQLAEGEAGLLDISFLTGLAQKSLAFYLSQAKEKAAAEPSFIVKP